MPTIDHHLTRLLLRLWGRLPLPAAVRGFILSAFNARFLVGACAVIFQDDRVLLVRHTYRPRRPWGLPAGWVNAREQPAEAIVREVEEETGYRIRAERVVGVRSVQRPRRLDVAYLCTIRGGEFRPSAEVSAAEFVPLAEARDRISDGYWAWVQAALDSRSGR